MKKKHDAETVDWKSKYLRALADYQNLEKRTQAEKQEIRKYAAEAVTARLLPALDTLTKASTHVKDTGLELALKELYAVLSEQGVRKIEVLGKPFDPHQMECIEVVAGKDNIVMEELLPGYRLHDKILRVAQVKVGKTLVSQEV
ncbi:MAG: nucleotide exchange factor GrpE [Candidatus Gottesmanbacteria bacterium]|nr:nucleotide exchange factor GrpE [Candidatus Gottesmanbacteria bacterium]